MNFKPILAHGILSLALRDALLPKLLSGELRVPAAADLLNRKI
jgi:hypothetical protein